MMGGFMMGIFNTSVVTGLSIAAAGILLKISGKSYSARCRRKVWIFLAFCLLMPFHLFRFPGAYTAEIPNIVLREFDAQASNGAGGAGQTDGDVQSAQNQPEQDQAVNDLVPQNSMQGNLELELTVADVFFAIWACVAVLLAVYYSAGCWRMRGRIRRWSSECEDSHVQEVMAEVAAECKLKRIPEVRIMRNPAEGPFTTGVLRNIIILPDDVLHEKDLRFILKHEAIHCRNHDISWRLFFLTVNIIHWFNPLVWYLRRAMEQDMEIACDEEVVNSASREKRKEYGDVIMSRIEKDQYKGNAVSTGYVNEVKFLKRRFESIFNGGKKKNGILLAGGICIYALFIGCVIQLQSGDKVYAKKQIPVSIQVFASEDVKVTPEIVEYDFESACEKGEKQQIYGALPGEADGIWYTVTVDGVEYYYARYDYRPDSTELFGYAIVGGEYSLGNGISLGMTKSEVIERYPAMAIATLDLDTNILNGVVGCMGWNPIAYPCSRAGMDEGLQYADGKEYRWDNQFDYVMIAEVEQPPDTLPVYVALMMKDDIVSAITFYYPTAG